MQEILDFIDRSQYSNLFKRINYWWITLTPKIIKSRKGYSYKETLEELGLTNLQERRLTGHLIETFKIWLFRIMIGIFSIFLLEFEIFCEDTFKKLSLVPTSCFAKRVIYFLNKTIDQTQNNCSTNN